MTSDASLPEMNMDFGLDLNPAGFQVCDGFRLDLDLIFLLCTSSQLSVLFRCYRLLQLICKFVSVEFLTSVDIVNLVCICIWITY